MHDADWLDELDAGEVTTRAMKIVDEILAGQEVMLKVFIDARGDYDEANRKLEEMDFVDNVAKSLCAKLDDASNAELTCLHYFIKCAGGMLGAMAEMIQIMETISSIKEQEEEQSS